MNGEAPVSTADECMVLIVDDDPDIAETLSLLLEDRGYRTETASNGREALERLGRLPHPSLILLDLTMPQMGGREFLHVQFQTPELASIPVVLVTADASAARSSAPNATGWLIKPIALDTLLETVARYCGRRR